MSRIRTLPAFAALFALYAAGAHAQPALVDVPLVEPFDGFGGAGFAPSPAAGRLDSDTWIVTGIAAGDLAFGDTAEAGAYARGTAAGAVDEAGVWAFTVAGGDPALGAQPSATELSPGAFEARFTNGSGEAQDSVTIAYECWQYNDGARATDVDVEVVAGGVAEQVAELGCTGTPAADGSPAWVSESLATVYTPASPIALDEEVVVRFVVDVRSGGAGFDQIAIDDVILGLPSTCGNGVVEGTRDIMDCDDGDPCTTDACVEPTGCTFTPVDMCEVDGGVADGDGGVSDGGPDPDGSTPAPRDASLPPRYDAGVRPNGLEPPDLGAGTGPEPDGCDCGVPGSGAPLGACWPLALVLAVLRRRR